MRKKKHYRYKPKETGSFKKWLTEKCFVTAMPIIIFSFVYELLGGFLVFLYAFWFGLGAVLYILQKAHIIHLF